MVRYKRRFVGKQRIRRYRQIRKIIDIKRRKIEQEFDEREEWPHEGLQEEPEIRKSNSTRELLRSWANCHGITTRAINDLLKILILAGIFHIFLFMCIFNRCNFLFIPSFKISGLQDLPKNYKALLKTPRNNSKTNIQVAAGGKLWYHGIKKNLEIIFEELKEHSQIELNFNVDGLPIFKSAKTNFWPILFTIHGKMKTQ